LCPLVSWRKFFAGRRGKKEKKSGRKRKGAVELPARTTAKLVGQPFKRTRKGKKEEGEK